MQPLSQERRAVLRVLVENPGGLRSVQTSELSGVTPGSVSNMLWRMERAGLAERRRQSGSVHGGTVLWMATLAGSNALRDSTARTMPPRAWHDNLFDRPVYVPGAAYCRNNGHTQLPSRGTSC